MTFVTSTIAMAAKQPTSEERFRLLADHAPVMIWVSGTDKLCTWFNKPWLDFVGRTMEQELGHGWSANVHAGDFDRCLQTYTAAFDARQPFTMDYRLRRHDGEYRWVLDNGIPTNGADGDFSGYIGSCIDITNHKRAEERLRESEQRLRLMADALPVLIAYVGSDRRYQFNNAAYEQWFGLPADACQGRHMREVLGEAGYSAIRAHVDAALAGQSRTFEAEMPCQTGETRGVLANYVPHRNAAGEVVGFYGLILDLTARKELEREVVETVSLEQRRIGQDLHDSVGQELTALKLRADELAEILQSDPAGATKLVEQMRRGLLRCSQDLRLVLRGLLPVAVDAEGLMAALAELAQRSQQEGKTTCTFECPEPVYVSDNLTATHVFLIAKEAVHNALKHARPREVHISLHEVGGCLILRVQDDGTNKSGTFLEHRGLGLRIMRNRAAILGGTLAVEPARPHGTVVICTIRQPNRS